MSSKIKASSGQGFLAGIAVFMAIDSLPYLFDTDSTLPLILTIALSCFVISRYYQDLKAYITHAFAAKSLSIHARLGPKVKKFKSQKKRY